MSRRPPSRRRKNAVYITREEQKDPNSGVNISSSGKSTASKRRPGTLPGPDANRQIAEESKSGRSPISALKGLLVFQAGAVSGHEAKEAGASGATGRGGKDADTTQARGDTRAATVTYEISPGSDDQPSANFKETVTFTSTTKRPHTCNFD